MRVFRSSVRIALSLAALGPLGAQAFAQGTTKSTVSPNTKPQPTRQAPVKVPPLVRQSSGAFSALMPKDWQLQTSATSFVSPNGNQVLRVRIGRDAGGPLESHALASVERFGERALKLKVISKNVVKANGRDMVTLLLDSWMVRSQKLHQYLTLRMMLRLPKRATIVTVSFSATGERMSTFLPLAEKVLSSIDFGSGAAAGGVR